MLNKKKKTEIRKKYIKVQRNDEKVYRRERYKVEDDNDETEQ